MDIKEIESAMHTLACGDTNFDTVARLASLVIVHDHLAAEHEQSAPFSSPEKANVPITHGSEFLEAASAVSLDDLMRILDAHMDALRVVIPAEYDAVMRRLFNAQNMHGLP